MTVETENNHTHVLHLISQIQCEDIRRQREMRGTNRQNLTVPVSVKSLDGVQEFGAVTRDLSSSGLGLISNEQIQEGMVCELALELESSTNSVVSKCLWCKPFGTGFFLSGWTFESVEFGA